MFTEALVTFSNPQNSSGVLQRELTSETVEALGKIATTALLVTWRLRPSGNHPQRPLKTGAALAWLLQVLQLCRQTQRLARTLTQDEMHFLGNGIPREFLFPSNLWRLQNRRMD